MRRILKTAALAALAIPGIAAAQSGPACAPDNAGLKLPPGFCAQVWADSLPQARHLVVAANGDVFLSMLGRAGGIMALRETKGSGRADVRQRFSSGYRTSEVALFDGYLYTEAYPAAAQGQPAPSISILRYPLKAGELTPSGPPDTIVSNIPGDGNHTTRNFTINRDGTMYVNIGSATNSCQEEDRKKGVMGKNPCTEVETRAGVWKFDARKKGQTPSAANHFARGIRNAVGIAMNPQDGKLWTTQHGRDQLGGDGGSWTFDAKYNSENPAEELVQANQGDDFGWPYCYFSVEEKKLVLAPEYGGDGKKTEQCASKKEPVAYFPGHWAPNALMFYTGSSFPAKYKNGAFIAFHGSWNRTGEPQAGFKVVFQPLKGEKTNGSYEIFADNFAPNLGTGAARGGAGIHRPTGLAQGTDGSLFVTDDAGGRIYRIFYTGK